MYRRCLVPTRSSDTPLYPLRVHACCAKSLTAVRLTHAVKNRQDIDATRTRTPPARSGRGPRVGFEMLLSLFWEGIIRIASRALVYDLLLEGRNIGSRLRQIGRAAGREKRE